MTGPIDPLTNPEPDPEPEPDTANIETDEPEFTPPAVHVGTPILYHEPQGTLTGVIVGVPGSDLRLPHFPPPHTEPGRLLCHLAVFGVMYRFIAAAPYSPDREPGTWCLPD